MDGATLVVFGGLAVIALLMLALFLRGERGRAEAAAQAAQLAHAAERLSAAQAELTGRLSQIAESGATAQAQLSERLQTQERNLAKAVDERLAEVTRRIGESLDRSATQAQTTIGELKERLAVIDAAQKNITELSTQVVGLQDILANKQARGAFGEIQLQDLVTAVLPAAVCCFQASLGENRRVDCLLRLPYPPGPIAIDAKFPLESYHALRNAADDGARLQAHRSFAAAIMKHVGDIASKYIVHGETADGALMFLPSEAVYAELHANFPEVVEKSYRAKVFIVSPTTLWATLNTVRAVLKDVRMREHAHVIQAEVRILLEDMVRLDDRVGKLQRHFEQTGEAIRQIRISTEKVTKRAERIGELEFEVETEAVEDLSVMSAATNA